MSYRVKITFPASLSSLFINVSGTEKLCLFRVTNSLPSFFVKLVYQLSPTCQIEFS